MQKIFNFTNMEKSEEAIQSTWEDFRNSLANKEFTYDNIQSALKTQFLSAFDDFFQHGTRFFEKSISSVLNSNIKIVRAARINKDDPKPGFDRFIPDAKYITNSNRFSPPGVEWLYLAFAPNENTGDLSLDEKCALKECRANVGDDFALCCFTLSDAYKDQKIIDLTIAKETEFEAINSELEKYGMEIWTRLYNEMCMDVISKGVLSKRALSKINLGNLQSEIEKWAVYTYARLLSEQIFLPLTTEDREIMYAPFQCMAQYFLKKGYIGIVYSSTVFPEGKNIVLFDKKAALPCGSIKTISVPIDL